MRIDRMEVEFGPWQLRGDIDGIFAGLCHARPTRFNLPDPLQVFHHRVSETRTRVVKVVSRNRQGSGRRPGPLFSGKLLARPGDHESISWVTAVIQMNPTRIAAYNIDAFRNPNVDLCLFADESVSDIRPEISLDGNDNVLPFEAVQGMEIEDWISFAGRILTAIADVISCCLGHVVHVPGFEDVETGSPYRHGHVTAYHPQARIHTIECYAELSTLDPTSLVAACESYFRPLGRRSRMRNYVLDYPASDSNRNSRSLSTTLPNDKPLRLYAKTSRRIRIEVTYSRSVLRDIIQRPRMVRLGNETDLGEVLLPIMNDSRSEINRAFSALYSALETSSSRGRNVYELLHHIALATLNEETTRLIVSNLINNGYIHA